jgi:hypothetical protein
MSPAKPWGKTLSVASLLVGLIGFVFFYKRIDGAPPEVSIKRYRRFERMRSAPDGVGFHKMTVTS